MGTIREKINRICETCGKEYQASGGWFCSQACWRAKNRNHPTDIIKTCKGCGYEYKTKSNLTWKEYCSRKCLEKYRPSRYKPTPICIQTKYNSWIKAPIKRQCKKCIHGIKKKWNEIYQEVCREEIKANDAADMMRKYKANPFRRNRVCLVCGKAFKAKSTKALYCSFLCAHTIKGCISCGDLFKLKRQHVSTMFKCDNCVNINKRKRHAKRQIKVKNARRYLKLYKLNHKKFKCAYCLNIYNINKLTVDHIIPISKGGLDMIDNFALACHQCNSHKTDKDLSKWIAEINQTQEQGRLAI